MKNRSIRIDTDQGYFDVYPDFKSKWVSSRQIEVLLPMEISAAGERYPVLYIHDGQNVFNAHSSFAGVPWDLHRTLRQLLQDQLIRPAIIVAIWNSPRRLLEYMPSLPAHLIPKVTPGPEWEGRNLSEEYLRFMVEELKPFIDSNYPTHHGPENTFVMGSSMGGLISFYALARYPDVFGGAACLSTHWPVFKGAYLQLLEDQLPDPGLHRFYFDYGTQTLDKQYEPYQSRVDTIMEKKGYQKGKDWITLKFSGHDHSESAWASRVDYPLRFLLGVKN